jgi:hypothetical protein
MLDVTVSEIRLQRPLVMASVGQGVATSMPQHVGIGLKAQLGVKARSIIRAKPAGVKGVARSDVKTNGDLAFALKPP